MKIFAFILLSLCLILAIIYGYVYIQSFILNLRLKRLNREHAQVNYQSVKTAYEYLLTSRRVYHKAKSFEDIKRMKEVQALCIEAHSKALRVLEDPTNTEYKECLSEEERRDLEETLALPRYELY